MNKAERIATIRRIVDRLGAEDDWAEIDFLLDQFEMRTTDRWNGNQTDYVREMIKSEDDGKLQELDHYLSGHLSPAEEPWDEGDFRLFISHLAMEKATAHELKSYLSFFGVDAFVAHEDIDPGKEWQMVILAALHSCDALVALLHDGFKESNWCDQEVGIALGRGLPVLSVKYELDPYGFFGAVQALNGNALQPKVVVRRVVRILLEDKRTSDTMVEAMVGRLEHAGSFDQANELAKMLADDAPLVTRDQVDRLRVAEKRNSQLDSAWDFDRHIGRIESELAASESGSTSTFEDAEEPF